MWPFTTNYVADMILGSKIQDLLKPGFPHTLTAKPAHVTVIYLRTTEEEVANEPEEIGRQNTDEFQYTVLSRQLLTSSVRPYVSRNFPKHPVRKNCYYKIIWYCPFRTSKRSLC